ncbi:MAG: endonuclease III [Spirochaetota bacterium]|nr:endonuclease III [Spirochaetota bacterium]
MWDDTKLINMFDILKNSPQLSEAPVVFFMSTVGDGPLRVLVSTILSLRTKDEVTGPATVRLFDVVTTPKDISDISIEQIEKLIYPVGFYKTKARQIHKIAHILQDTYDSTVPADLDLLLELPGVGRKTANLVMAVAFEKPAICVDIHVHRISNRLGICKTKNPEETEFYLRDTVSQNIWNEFNRPLVALGQVICRPISPKCSLCPIENMCDKKIIKNIKANKR